MHMYFVRKYAGEDNILSSYFLGKLELESPTVH
jgi:hypothetical protein